ncbi:hypothetical protein GUJ93_ZPchr0003g18618 [Zizania palustris]|uniref:Uncharacterized protein n=1 Tax=Zizania palustris TaxID=103762 RepID=A0A8J5VET4_ZIZPA|nr:hypothetical protein GUJ93_ZPchr0003g18618 [Zizania palustris]
MSVHRLVSMFCFDVLSMKIPEKTVFPHEILWMELYRLLNVPRSCLKHHVWMSGSTAYDKIVVLLLVESSEVSAAVKRTQQGRLLSLLSHCTSVAGRHKSCALGD